MSSVLQFFWKLPSTCFLWLCITTEGGGISFRANPVFVTPVVSKERLLSLPKYGSGGGSAALDFLWCCSGVGDVVAEVVLCCGFVV